MRFSVHTAGLGPRCETGKRCIVHFPYNGISAVDAGLPRCRMPTAAESGFPEFIIGTWWAMFALKGTGQKIIDRLATEVCAALGEPGDLKSPPTWAWSQAARVRRK